MERAITSLPPEYRRIDPPEYEDMKDWPRIAKLQSDLLAQALITRQTRVASYMLTKCQSLTLSRGLAIRRRGITTIPMRRSRPRRRRSGRTAYLTRYLPLARAGICLSRRTAESDSRRGWNLLDHCCLIYAHEHAEANPHKNNGLGMIIAGHTGRMATGKHTETTATVGDVYVTLADDIMGANIGTFPTRTRRVTELLA